MAHPAIGVGCLLFALHKLSAGCGHDGHGDRFKRFVNACDISGNMLFLLEKWMIGPTGTKLELI
jgi:hypothetical protein